MYEFKLKRDYTVGMDCDWVLIMAETNFTFLKKIYIQQINLFSQLKSRHVFSFSVIADVKAKAGPHIHFKCCF